MRIEVSRRLEQAGPCDTSEATVIAFNEALGVDVAALRTLQERILEDFDTVNFGISWWSALPAEARVGIADYLYELSVAIQTALCDAALHLEAAEKHFEEEGARLARVVAIDGSIRFPRTERPREMLAERLASLHTGGYFRAIASSLDLLAGTAIGVVGIPIPIVRSDFGKLRAFLDAPNPRSPRHPLHNNFASKLRARLESAGPDGWTEWATQYRNMLVHRAPRAEGHYLHVSASILDANGRPIPRAEPVLLLVRAPGHTNIEAIRAANTDPAANLAHKLFLTEDGRLTLRELLKSTLFTIRNTVLDLIEVWDARRETPSDPLQPEMQWNPQATAVTFSGFFPDQHKFTPDAAYTGGKWDLRLKASGLLRRR